MSGRQPLLVVTPGMGIGPEVTLRALAPRRGPEHARVVLCGRRAAAEPWAASVGVELHARPSLAEAADVPPDSLAFFDPGDETEPAEVAAIRAAAAACLDGTADAMVTGPIHKAQLVARGFAHRGHTDFLGHLCGGVAPVMAFAGGELRVALVTTHIPLAAVSGALTVQGIAHTVRVAAAALRDDLGIPSPRLALCGLNPHAGEGGLLGTEEQDTIGPAAQLLRAEGLDLTGPVSAETAFLLARQGATDMVVAMYHDQGLAPLKAVDFGRSVNWTLGLPLVRTSVDHGTADSLVGTGRADPSSMGAALDLASAVVRHRRARR